MLVVEDEQSFSDPLSYLLAKEGYEVDVVENGPDALAFMERQGTDLVLLDLMLPGISGTEVCRRIRATSSVPVIMLTAKDSEIDKVVGLELGADDYVTKPFSPRELVGRMRAVRRRRVAAGEALSLLGIDRSLVLSSPIEDCAPHRSRTSVATTACARDPAPPSGGRWACHPCFATARRRADPDAAGCVASDDQPELWR